MYACVFSFGHKLSEEFLEQSVLALKLLERCRSACWGSLWFCSKQVEIEVLVPRHEQICGLVKDVAEKVVSTQGTRVIAHAHPGFLLPQDHQFAKASRLDDEGAFIRTPAHVCP